jgi:hypothetical protein
VSRASAVLIAELVVFAITVALLLAYWGWL